MTDIKEIVATVNKQFGESTLGFANDLKYAPVDRLSSGSLFLDYVLGKNIKSGEFGWPLGRIIELYGKESSGKSLISMKTIAEAQKKGMNCAYIDSENAFDMDFAKKLGVDVSKLLISREDRAGHILDMVCKMLSDDADIKVVVFDSLASMIPEVEIEASLEDQQMASIARIMSKGLRKLISFNKNRALFLFINQLRVNPGAGMYANPEYTPGGNALKYYSSIRVDVHRGDWITDETEKKKKIGQVVKFRIVKNKTDVPHKEGYFKFLYTGELDRIDELVSLGLLGEKITRKGAYYSILDRTFQGREDMEKALNTEPEVFEKARKEIFNVS